MMAASCSIVLQNELPEITRLVSSLEKFGEENAIPLKMLHALQLAADELVTNIISYGYADALKHEINVTLDYSGSAVTMIIIDDAKQFDPLAAPEADTSIPLEEKKIGGLGIHLVKAMMDEIAYRHEDGKNILSMTKKST